MLFKISLKNIRKSMREYAIYFCTLIIGVCIFYVFNAIESQTVLLNITKNMKEIIKLMMTMMNGVSVFVSFVLGFLIIYASQFLMKRRNKEFGLYLVLGMGKRKISLILFFETLVIGLISLVAGLFVGVGVSQVMSGFVANMFDADMTKFTFVFSKSACLKTILYFSVMYLVVIVFNTISVNRYQLIDLLQAGRKTEKVKSKNLILCSVVFVMAAACLVTAYRIVTVEMVHINQQKLIISIMLGVLGTFCVFWSLSGLLLRLFLSVKKIYFRNLNSFTLRQLSSKINTNVFSVTVICILLFLVICILSSAMSLKKSLEKNLDDTAPVDIQIDKVIGETDESELSQNKIDSQKMTIEQVYQKGGCNLFDYLDEWAAVKVYSSPDLTFRDTMGSEFDEIKDSVSFMAGTSEMVVKVSEYNKIAELYGLETYTLKEDEYIMVADYTEVVRFRNMALQKGKKINVFGHELSPKYTECKEGFLQIGATHSNTGFLLVSDDIPDENSFSAEYLAGNYKANSKEERLEIDKKIAGMNKKLEKQDYIVPTCDTKNDITEASIGLGAMATFLGIYLGIIFLISCAAMLALKELAESVDNRERYETLRRLGADEKMISQALFKQIGTFFLLPLMLAVVHAVFGMKFSAAVLQSIGTSQISSSMLVTAGILVFVYGGYFVLTYLCGRKYIR